MRNGGSEWQVHLASKRTASEALRQALELKMIKLVVGSFIIFQKMSDRALFRSQPPLKWKKEG
jgi:hypothetical protein